MKIKKIISMLMVAVFIIGLMAGCTDKSKEIETKILERKNELREGETLMAGYADFPQTDIFAVSFILSEDKNSIMNINVYYSSTGVNYYYDSYTILNGEIDVMLKNAMFENGRLILTFNDNTANGTIEYSKSSLQLNINDSNSDIETQSDYFGTQRIEFTAK